MNAQNNLHHERSGLNKLKAKLFKSLRAKKKQKQKESEQDVQV